MRALFVAIIFATVPFAGCFGTDSVEQVSPEAPTPGTPTPQGELPVVRDCLEVRIQPASSPFYIYQTNFIRFTLDNCGSGPVDIPFDPCDPTRGFAPEIRGNGTVWPLRHSDSADATGLPCDREHGEESPRSIRVASGGSWEEGARWNGTIFTQPLTEWSDVTNVTTAPPGSYTLVVKVHTENLTQERYLNITLAPPAVPEYDDNSSIQFVFNESYRVGEKMDVRVKNTGNTTYSFNPWYQACSMSYFTDEGRSFRIPPGTHCDLIGQQKIEPGETVTLFTWLLDECTKDTWGCAEAKTLPPGQYHLRGTFYPYENDFSSSRTHGTRAGGALQIVA